MNAAVAKKTQETLGKVIKKPPLTDMLLGKPPFRYLLDIFCEVIRRTGFMKGLYLENEMKSDNFKEKDSKIVFLQKAIDVVMLVSGEALAVKPARIVAGHEPERTNELLQAIARCCLSKVWLTDREDLGESSRPRRKKHDYRIALFGGSQPQSCRYFNPKDSSWTDIRCPFEKRRDATVVFWDNVVYILGGSQLFPIKRMDCYNVLKDSWYSKLGPRISRDSLSACASQGKIYTSGGSEVGSSALDLFECYDTRTESWQVKASMLMARCSHGSAEANGLIYVCGGTVGNNLSGRVLNNCEVYDPATQQWRELCGMRESRKNHGLVVVNNRIYAIGGQGAVGGLDSVEYYDIASNEWRVAAPMPWRGLTVKCAAVGDVIYVLAGFQGVGRLGHVLEYFTEIDRWVTCTAVRAFPVTSCLICVVDTCGVNEDEDMDLIDSQTTPEAPPPPPPTPPASASSSSSSSSSSSATSS